MNMRPGWDVMEGKKLDWFEREHEEGGLAGANRRHAEFMEYIQSYEHTQRCRETQGERPQTGKTVAAPDDSVRGTGHGEDDLRDRLD